MSTGAAEDAVAGASTGAGADPPHRAVAGANLSAGASASAGISESASASAIEDTVGSAADSSTDRAAKRERVMAVLDEVGATSVLLTSAAAVAWYLDGGRQNVSLAADPIVAVRVSRDADEAFVTSNESARLVAEELPAGITVQERAWYEPLDASRVPVSAGARATDSEASALQLGIRDRPLRERDVDDRLRAARAVMLPGELARYRSLSRDAACAVTEVLLTAEPAWTERRLAAELAARLVAAGADPLVLLVAGESRSALPHPLPTNAQLGRRAMVVVCARRDGLITNLSRWVSFGPLTDAERDAQRRILQVEVAAFDATLPGTPLSEVLAAIADAYPANGFDADQWTRHHQGGAAGYNGRDPRAAPSTTDPVRLGQAFTWNPWAPGTKVEDTVLVTGSVDTPVIQPLTVDERWPVEFVAGRVRPVTLER